MPVRIMHIVDTLAVGGLQNGLANLIDRMETSRFEHVVCAMRPIDEANMQRFFPGRARVMSLSTEESASRFQIWTLARKIRAVEPDIVHTRNWGTGEGQLAARYVGGCRCVHSEHGIDWDTTTNEPKRRILFRRMAFQLADRVLSVSYQLRDLHARRTGFPARKIAVIHNGVDSRLFFPDASVRGRVRRELGVGEDELCLGCVGNLIPVKDHITLLKAVDEFAKGGRPWRLLIAGDGPEFSKLAEFVNGHEIWKDRITFLGRSSSVPELLKAMDVYISSSLTEGISNSVLEAMATGLPVVVTATGGNPEVVVDGESGLLFPVGDWLRLANHLRSLEAQRELRTVLGQRALRRVREEFSIDSMVGNYTRTYEDLLVAGAAPVSTVARA
jgi:sugar transferase (PEP-CTERM/EpsH1 system associated)